MPHWKVKRRNRQSAFKSCLQKREQEEKKSQALVNQSKQAKASFFPPS